MLYVWEKAKDLGLTNIPEKFYNHYGAIPWGFSWDRGFLIDYYDVGLKLYNEQNYDDAYWVFSHLLELDKSDRLRASYYAINCCFEFGRYLTVINICDSSAHLDKGFILFSKTLAMYPTYEDSDFEEQLKKAISEYPYFAKLIARKNKKSNYVLSDSRDADPQKEEAKFYWNMHGKYWLQHNEAIALVRKFYRAYTRKHF